MPRCIQIVVTLPSFQTLPKDTLKPNPNFLKGIQAEPKLFFFVLFEISYFFLLLLFLFLLPLSTWLEKHLKP